MGKEIIMTRINIGIDPQELCMQHLIAEHREIKRIPNAIKNGKAKLTGIPETFRLGSGHVKFFYNKLGYLKDRYQLLYNECIERGYKVQNYLDAWDDIPAELMGNYEPSSADIQLIKNRIAERLQSMNMR